MPSLAGLTRPSAHLQGADAKTTLDWMVRETHVGLRDVELRLFAEQLVGQLMPHDYLSEYAAILRWVSLHIRYSRDPTVIEQVKTPRATIETETGDCDDQTVLIGSLIGALGGKVRYVAGAFQRDATGRPMLSHVWAEAFDPTSRAWVVLDPVPGRNVARMLRRLVDSVVVNATF